MSLIDLYYMRCEVIKSLCELSLEEIFTVQEEFKRLHPDDYQNYIYLFDRAIRRKCDELSMKEIIALVDKQKKRPIQCYQHRTGQRNQITNHGKSGTPAL